MNKRKDPFAHPRNRIDRAALAPAAKFSRLLVYVLSRSPLLNLDSVLVPFPMPADGVSVDRLRGQWDVGSSQR